MSDGNNNSRRTFNEFQVRHLKIACQHIDKLLGDMEEVLHSSESKSVFPRYVAELSPVQRKTIEDYAGRVRGQLLRVLAAQGIDPEPVRIRESHSLHTILTFIEITLEELTPDDMAGYGAVSPAAATDLNGIVQELGATVSEMHAYVLDRSRQDIEERLRAFGGVSDAVQALTVLQKVIDRHGLVEFRPRLLRLIDEIEDRSFEIAVFGRVSSGKSSLLNRLLQRDVLPVGVTPITAVPTRIRYAAASNLVVVQDNCPPSSFGIEELGSFVDERQNPGNAKRVARIAVEIPSDLLRNGLVFVDTPGLGSLATTGAAETLAYLPRCDYGIVLIDAAGSLASEDLRTIEALKNASIPVSVLVSKADLITDQDLRHEMDYISRHVAEEIGFAVPVHAVSIRNTHHHLLDRWLHGVIQPLQGRANEMKELSLARKAERLVSAVIGTLRTLLNTQNNSELAGAVERELRHASSKIADSRSAVSAVVDALPAKLNKVSEVATENLVKAWSEKIAEPCSSFPVILAAEMKEGAHRCHSEVSQLATELRHALRYSSEQLHGEAERIEQFQFRELPIFEMRLDDVAMSPPAWSVLGRKVSSMIARHEVRELRNRTLEAVNLYARKLLAWAEAAIGEVEHQYDSYATSLRAQAERLATGTANGVGVSEVRSDIALLDELLALAELRPASGM